MTSLQKYELWEEFNNSSLSIREFAHYKSITPTVLVGYMAEGAAFNDGVNHVIGTKAQPTTKPTGWNALPYCEQLKKITNLQKSFTWQDTKITG